MAACPVRQYYSKTVKFIKTPERKHVVLLNSTVLMSQDNVVDTMTRLWTEQLTLKSLN